MSSATAILGGHTYFLHWGVIQISLANFLVIVTMVVLFVLALILPFPHGRANAGDDEQGSRPDDRSL